jgi:hypothetical protein
MGVCRIGYFQNYCGLLQRFESVQHFETNTNKSKVSLTKIHIPKTQGAISSLCIEAIPDSLLEIPGNYQKILDEKHRIFQKINN